MPGTGLIAAMTGPGPSGHGNVETLMTCDRPALAQAATETAPAIAVLSMSVRRTRFIESLVCLYVAAFDLVTSVRRSYEGGVSAAARVSAAPVSRMSPEVGLWMR